MQKVNNLTRYSKKGITVEKKEVLIIIPAYNEEANIVRVVKQLEQEYSQYDYIVVNDGSKDKTADICINEGFNLLDLPVNLGLSGAFQAGMKYAYKKGYKYAIQFDGDGQHLPQYIESLLEEMQKGNQIVIGSRFVTEKKPKTLRMFGSNMISIAIRLSTGKKINDPTSGMRMYDRNMIEKFAKNMDYGPEPDTISHLIRNGIKVSETQVKMEERIAGESYLNAGKAMMYMIRMLCSILIIQNFRKKER